MNSYPNTEPLERGAFVVNVHPCGRYDDTGIVLQAPGGPFPDDSVTVATGRGSTCYGPAANWAPTDRRPEWLERLELEQSHALHLERVRDQQRRHEENARGAAVQLEALELAEELAR